AIPLTLHGKVDRSALAELDPAQPAPDPGVDRLTPAEREIAEIWAELTDVLPGPDDDFFSIGGHSLLAARMVSAVRSRLQVEIDLSEVFAHPRLSDFARRVTAAEGR
ncbi:MAG: phosphopantetheine-binding protein, partial [Streptomyces sp.]|nr:phosphopantetheine-binding protein [Streptomyces sp.]